MSLGRNSAECELARLGADEADAIIVKGGTAWIADLVQQAVTQIEAARDEALAVIRDMINVQPISIKNVMTPEMQTRLAAMRTARSNVQPIVIDSVDDNAHIERDRLIYGTGFGKLRVDGTLEHVPAPDVLMFPRDTEARQPAEVHAVVEARALELYAAHVARRGFGSGTKLSDQVRSAIQAIVELIAKGDR